MTWRLSIEHVTSYEYEGEVLASYNEARMSPARDATPDGARPSRRRAPERSCHALRRLLGYRSERVRRARAARPAHRRRRAHWSRPSQPFPTSPTPIGRSCSMKTFATASTSTCTRHRTFRSTSRSARSRPMLAAGRTPRETVEAVSAWVRENLAYEPGATDVSTNARSALELGSRRLPGLRPRRAGVAARRRHPGALRLRLPASRCRRRRRCRGDRPEPRLARSVDGVLAAHRPDQRRRGRRTPRARRARPRLRRRHPAQGRVQRPARRIRATSASRSAASPEVGSPEAGPGYLRWSIGTYLRSVGPV